MQASYINKETKKVAGHGLTENQLHSGDYSLICGSNVLTNEQVNVLSVLICTGLGGWVIGPLLFG